MSRQQIIEWCLDPPDLPPEPTGPTEAIDPDEGPLQLSLFTPERLDLGAAWDALACLDVEEGLALFDTLAHRYPGSREARDGLAIARFWQPALAATRGASPGDAAATLWRHLRERDERDPLLTPRLRRALTARLLAQLRATNEVFMPPDLPRGTLLLWLGRTAEAAADLRAAWSAHPEEPAVLFSLAEAEWRLNHCAAARVAWARLLVVAPGTALGRSAPPDLLAVIQRHDAAWAPHYGWIEGVLPLVEVPDQPADGGPRDAYATLGIAEAARRCGDHGAAVAARLCLRELAPDLLEAYLARLERAAG